MFRKYLTGIGGVGIVGVTGWNYYKKTQVKRVEQVEREITPTIVICGAGTGGCVTAYFLAKWLEENRIPGKVLLLDSGKEYFSATGPSPYMDQWYHNWGDYSRIHESSAVDDLYSPSPGSSHNGIGGAGAHDTRISFIPTEAQRKRYATAMNWSSEQMNMYLQTVLNMIPLQSAGEDEIFYNAVIDTLHTKKVLSRKDEYKGEITPNSIGYVSVAMFPDATRWTSAYLLHNSVRPKNLIVRSGIAANRILFRESDKGDTIKAIGIETDQGEIIPAAHVVITAGSISTPAILQRSGIGPKKLLDELSIPIVIANDEVGHGVDHMEVPVVYKWNAAYCQPNGNVPLGGPMGWPIALFPTTNDSDPDSVFMAHFGISPPPYGGGDVTATPNCPKPDSKEGFRVFIRSTNPNDTTSIVHEECANDFDVLHDALLKTIGIFDVLEQSNIVGNRVDPPLDLDLDDRKAVKQWMSHHVATVYHWMSTCKAGTNVNTTVADEHFRVRRGLSVIPNLRIGSGAVLPEIPEANPHITIATFSVALAHELYTTLLAAATTPSELNTAKSVPLTIRRVEEVHPNLWPIAKEHQKIYQKH